MPTKVAARALLPPPPMIPSSPLSKASTVKRSAPTYTLHDHSVLRMSASVQRVVADFNGSGGWGGRGGVFLYSCVGSVRMLAKVYLGSTRGPLQAAAVSPEQKEWAATFQRRIRSRIRQGERARGRGGAGGDTIYLQMWRGLLELFRQGDVCKGILDAPEQREVPSKPRIHLWGDKAVGVGREVVEQHGQLAVLQYGPEESLNACVCDASQVVRREDQDRICYCLLALHINLTSQTELCWIRSMEKGTPPGWAGYSIRLVSASQTPMAGMSKQGMPRSALKRNRRTGSKLKLHALS